jgi:predicted ATPase
VADHDARLRGAVEAAGGYVVKTEGDAVFAAFADPPAAVSAVVAGFRALAAAPFAGSAEVKVRAGLHTGVGRLRTDLAPGAPQDYVGIDVNFAARVAAAANGGQILVSDATVGAAGGVGSVVDELGGTELLDEGLRSLKDFEEPGRLYRLVIAGAAEDARPLRTLDAPSNLPQETTSLVGREAEIERLAEELQRGRIVTLTGPGGSGKTRLAIGVAQVVRGSFPHGTWFVDLSDVRDASRFEPTIALTIGIRETADQTLADALRRFLRDRQVLIVLDNVEQLLPPAAEATAGLIRSAPGLRILATSRELLRIGGERSHVVPPLGLQDGIELFEDRARLQRPDLVIDQATRDTISEICRRLDGLPLAIELAAARIRVLSPAAILDRLGRSLDLSGGARDLPERQRTLRAAIDWSHELLSDGERRLFRRLAVFAGGWTADAATSVTDADGDLGIDVLDGLESLLDKSLVRPVEAAGGPDSSGETRFSMHALLNEYATERLAAADERPRLEARLAAVMRTIAERTGSRLLTAEGERALALLDDEQHNLRAAVEWSIRTGEVATGLAILGATWRWFQQRGRLREGRALLADLLDRPAAAPKLASDEVLLRIAGLAADGGLAYWMEDVEGARARYQERIDLATQTFDPRLIADAHYDLGFLSMIDSDPAGLDLHEGRALELYLQIGDEAGAERARQAQNLRAFLVGDYEMAQANSEQNLLAFRRLGSMFQVADALTLLSAIAWRRGDVGTSWGHLMEGLRIFVDRDMASGLARALGMAALIELTYGDPEFGARLAGATAELRREKSVMVAPTRVLHLPDAVDVAIERFGPERGRALLAEGSATPVGTMVELVFSAPVPGPSPTAT